MSLPTHLTLSAEAMARQVGEETVILDLASGNYFGLDPIGTRVWQLLGEGVSLSSACDLLLAEYEVSREQLESDLERLVGDLLARGLVSIR